MALPEAGSPPGGEFRGNQTCAPATGMRVLEFSESQCFAIPYAGKLLADLGATVRVVEPHDGHPLRHGHPGAPPERLTSSAVYDFLTERKQLGSVDSSDLLALEH